MLEYSHHLQLRILFKAGQLNYLSELLNFAQCASGNMSASAQSTYE